MPFSAHAFHAGQGHVMTIKKQKVSRRFHAEKSTARTCRCQLAERRALGLGPLEELFLDLARLHCTAIATDQDAARSAARELATSRLGITEGQRFFVCVTDLMEAIRRDRPGPFGFLPACCTVVCADELDMIALLRACRFSNKAIIETRVSQLLQGMESSAVIAAAHAVVRAGRNGADALQIIHASLSDTGIHPSRVLH